MADSYPKRTLPTWFTGYQKVVGARNPDTAIAANVNTFQRLISELGGAGYMEAFPEVFNPAYRWYNDTRYGLPSSVSSAISGQPAAYQVNTHPSTIPDQIADWRNVKNQVQGTAGTYIRWLIDKKIADLEYERQRQMESAAASTNAYRARVREAVAKAIVLGWRPSPEARKQLKPFYREATAPEPERREIKMPIPDWMQPYISQGNYYSQYQSPELATEKVDRTQAGTLRPMSGQSNLTPEQMELMGGYEGWGRAGAPTSIPSVEFEDLFTRLANWQPWWQAYIKQSQKLLPTAGKLRTSWRPTRQ